MDVFPSTYIPIGGDEAPRKRWKECPVCQQRIRREHLEAVEGQSAEARLQGYFTKRVEKFVNSRGRKLIGWDELLETGVDATATIMSWRGVSGGLVASEKGHDVIMAPVDYCYFNFYLTKDHDWGEPFAFDAVIPLENTYGFAPAPDTLSEAARRHVLGVQGNLWTEYIPFESQAQYQVLPRMGALAEVQWMAPGRKDYSQWRERQKGLLTVYDKYGWAWAPHLSEE
jgi:hexosaminidase